MGEERPGALFARKARNKKPARSMRAVQGSLGHSSARPQGIWSGRLIWFIWFVSFNQKT